MSTKIAWAEETWNPITGCTKISDGCKNCYAFPLVRRFPLIHGITGTGVSWDPVEPEPKDFGWIQFHPERLKKPLSWKKPRKVFVCSMGDLFHVNVEIEHVKQVFDIVFQCRRHTFMFLTKRPENMRTIFDIVLADKTPAVWMMNCWAGVTVESEKYLHRIDTLLQIPSAVRFVSVEPMLGPVDIATCTYWDDPSAGIHWVIIGCESGPGRRPCEIEWMIDLVAQCKDAGVPVFVKQVPVNGRVSHKMEEWPEALQVQEYPR